MNKQGKAVVIAELKEKFSQYNNFYIADTSTLTVEDINALRRTCFEKGIQVVAAKNTLIQKALEQVEANDYTELYDSLVGHSTLMFSENANLPAKVIKEFRSSKDKKKPELKIAYIDTDVFKGDSQLDALVALKSKYELLGEIVGLLQSPAKNVVSALQSGGKTLAGIVKTLSEKEG